ncbi:MAG: hypothetical protein CVT60_02395 [Actinobacteria bacterium HGW-Actinobacteria-10]|jgi:hypothetical protein|nr:MAG: hypothetical protein CVT60_02395 [Actinobacteria bacterium HGW-Actinobacteria-10]
MNSRRSLTIVTLVLAGCSAFFAILWAPLPGSGLVSTTVDLTAPVTAVNCNPCHARIAETDVKGLIFSHGNHLLVECTSCHVQTPHEDGVTTRPAMSTCFVCHSLSHGSQAILAAGECADCHTPEHVMRPTSHVKGWAAKPHATASAGGANDCMLCHQAPEDCDVCHVEQSVDVGKMPAIYLRNIPVTPERPSVTIDTRAAPESGSCVFCHKDIDRTDNGRITFVHEPHMERGYQCKSCHEVFPHAADRTTVPDMQSCYRCHGLKHASWGEFATQECLACHPRSFPLKPIDHTTDFVMGEHKKQATGDIGTCTMCHQSDFCVPCHNAQKKLPDGSQSPKVIPVDHTKPEWRPGHGDKFLAQEGSCSVCHTNQSCTRCHLTPMPHPTTWMTQHTENGYPTKDCDVCHSDKSTCQECHHGSLENDLLVAENCVGCHEEMKTDPPTSIKNISLAEHAVHFNVQERVGRLYVCDDCHIGFTVARVMQPASQTQAHDLRLCYDCHGNLNPATKLIIAPYSGSDLCRQCHKDLNI